MPIGRVKWFNDRKNYGFLTDGGRHDIMVHFSVIEGEGYRTLNDGELVEFEAEQGPKGRVATRVVRLEGAATGPQAQQPGQAAEAAAADARQALEQVFRPSAASAAAGSGAASGSRRGALRPRFQ